MTFHWSVNDKLKERKKRRERKQKCGDARTKMIAEIIPRENSSKAVCNNTV